MKRYTPSFPGDPRQLIVPANQGSLFADCTTANLPDADPGYEPGSLLIDTQAGKVYRNDGTSTSCSFTEIQSSTDFLGAAQVIKPSGQVYGYGFGAATAAARGTALAEAVAAHEAGDRIEIGPGLFTVTARMRLRSGVSVRGRGEGITELKLGDAANCAIFENYNLVATASASVTETDISISDLTLNGNDTNQTRGTLSPAVRFLTCLKMWGVDGVRVRNVTFKYPANFSAWFANWKNVTLENINIVTNTGTIYTDGVHFNGNGQFLTIRNIRGNSYDDFIALNGDDDPALFSPYSVTFHGYIKDVLIDGVQFDDPLLGIRLLSSGTANGSGTGSAVDRILVKNVTGTCLNTVMHADGYGGGDSQIGSVTIDTVDVSIHDPTVYSNGAAGIHVNQLVEKLTIRNWTKHNSPYVCPVLNVLGSGNIGALSIDGLHIKEATAAATSQIAVLSGAYVGLFNIANVTSYNATKRTTGTIINNAGHCVFGINATNCSLWNTGYLIYSTSDIATIELHGCKTICNNPPTLADAVPLVQLSGVSATIGAYINASCCYAASIYGTASSAPTPTVRGDGQIVEVGSYTPTLTSGNNAAAQTAYVTYWTRIGSRVHVSGRLDVDPTSASTLTQVGVSLPIASNLANEQDLTGYCVPIGVANCGVGAVRADTGNDRAYLDFICGTNVANQQMDFAFDYVIL